MTDKITPAFPVSALVYNYDDGAPDTIIHEGMFLRDYFAARAMQALITNETIHSETMKASHEAGIFEELALSTMAYAIADAMLKARQA